MAEEVQIRIHGEDARLTLVFLPGMHGDWTLVGNFRRALGRRARFVEITYPRTLDWSLEEYAAAIEAALLNHGIRRGWLLGESFGSQIAWPMLARGTFQTEGVILAGGFVKHPARWAVRLAARTVASLPLSWWKGILSGYSKLSRFRFRHSPETQAELREFSERRTERDRQAIRHRLNLIAQSDFRPVVRKLQPPVFGLSGALDALVPWILARRGFRRTCPTLREFRILWPADHTVLSSAPEKAADLVVGWMSSEPGS